MASGQCEWGFDEISNGILMFSSCRKGQKEELFNVIYIKVGDVKIKNSQGK